MSPNRLLCDSRGNAYDILCGTFLIAGISGENFASLPDHLLHSYKAMFDNLRMYAIPLEVSDSQEKHPEHKKKRGESHER